MNRFFHLMFLIVICSCTSCNERKWIGNEKYERDNNYQKTNVTEVSWIKDTTANGATYDNYLIKNRKDIPSKFRVDKNTDFNNFDLIYWIGTSDIVELSGVEIYVNYIQEKVYISAKGTAIYNQRGWIYFQAKIPKLPSTYEVVIDMR